MKRLGRHERGDRVILEAEVISQVEGMTFVRFVGGHRWFLPSGVLVRDRNTLEIKTRGEGTK